MPISNPWNISTVIPTMCSCQHPLILGHEFWLTLPMKLYSQKRSLTQSRGIESHSPPFFLLWVYLFRVRVSLCSTGWPGTHGNPFVSASQVLGSQVLLWMYNLDYSWLITWDLQAAVPCIRTHCVPSKRPLDFSLSFMLKSILPKFLSYLHPFPLHWIIPLSTEIWCHFFHLKQ